MPAPPRRGDPRARQRLVRGQPGTKSHGNGGRADELTFGSIAALPRWAYASVMMPECKICLDTHDPEIHDATRRIHEWFREQIALMTEPFEEFVEIPVAAEQ